jgi:hypothetical protein
VLLHTFILGFARDYHFTRISPRMPDSFRTASIRQLIRQLDRWIPNMSGGNSKCDDESATVTGGLLRASTVASCFRNQSLSASCIERGHRLV